MADNVTTQIDTLSSLPSSTVIATDQLADGSHVQKVKVLSGSSDTATPVLFTETPSGLAADVRASVLPTGASTEATLALIRAKTDNIDVALSTRTKPADQQHVIVDSSASIPVTGPLTDAQLRATPVPVSGTVTVTDGSGPITVDGTVAVSGSVAVTGPLTDTQLRATPVPVSGTVTITDGSGPVTVDGTVAVSNFPATQPISAAALPLPAGAATDASLVTLDADLKAEIGTVAASPSAYSVLDRLASNGRRLDALASSVATEATLKKLLVALSRPVVPAYTTLLHR